jgi:hypothetical protein
MTNPVQREEAILRRAVHSGDFAGAESAARLYVAALGAVLPQLPPAQAPGLLRDACDLIEWARRCLCVARAQVSGKLSGIRHVAAFRRTAQPDILHTWRIDG